jgi:hypothetical protein
MFIHQPAPVNVELIDAFDRVAMWRGRADSSC